MICLTPPRHYIAKRPNRRRILISAVAAAVASFIAIPTSALAADDFASWLTTFRAEASEKGIREDILDAALGNIKPIPRVIELDRKQPEFSLTFQQYMDRVVPNSRVKKGRARLAENKALLDAAAKKHGVQPRFIVAFWGVETDFGRVTGGFKVVPALATLAHDGRRSAYFRKELHNALRILNEGHIAPDAMVGSWAGAMGQPQFMPSSFLNFAVDGDGDGHKDIWTTKTDVFSSAANYLSKSGWRADQTWGRAVKVPSNFDESMVSLKIVKTISEWQSLGVRRVDGTDLPTRNLKASIVRPGDNGPPYMVYNNFRTILKWNRSTYFAIAIGTLADKIGAGS